MKASVIIPTYNDDLRLEWVLAGLAQQTVRDFEVIVVNDGGDGSTLSLFHQFALPGWRYSFLLPSPDFRAGQARNHGVRLSTGELLILLDCDAVPAPNLVECHLAHLAPDALGCGRSMDLPIDKVAPLSGALDFDALKSQAVEDNYHEPWRAVFVSRHCSMPAKLFCEIGGFDERAEGYGWEDADLFPRLLRAGGTAVNLNGLTTVVHLMHEPRAMHQGRREWQDTPMFGDETIVRNGGPLIRQCEA